MADEKTEVEITKGDIAKVVTETASDVVIAKVDSAVAVQTAEETHEELEEHKDAFKEALDAIDDKFSSIQSAFSDLSEKVSGFIESSKKIEVEETKPEKTGDLPIIEVEEEIKPDEIKPPKRKRFFI